MVPTPVPATPTMIAVPTSQVVVATGMQSSPSLAPPIKKQKTAGEKQQGVTSVQSEFDMMMTPPPLPCRRDAQRSERLGR